MAGNNVWTFCSPIHIILTSSKLCVSTRQWRRRANKYTNYFHASLSWPRLHNKHLSCLKMIIRTLLKTDAGIKHTRTNNNGITLLLLSAKGLLPRPQLTPCVSVFLIYHFRKSIWSAQNGLMHLVTARGTDKPVRVFLPIFQCAGTQLRALPHRSADSLSTVWLINIKYNVLWPRGYIPLAAITAQQIMKHR